MELVYMHIKDKMGKIRPYLIPYLEQEKPMWDTSWGIFFSYLVKKFSYVISIWNNM